VKDSLLLKPFN